MFENTYLVTDKLETFTHEDVDAVEAALGTRFPVGYREYVTTLGRGEYCSYINVFPPQEIVENQTGGKPPLQEFCHSWDGAEFGITPERLAKSVMIANSINGDWIVFEASLPETIYILPSDESVMHKVEALTDVLTWLYEPEGNARFRFFISAISQQEQKHISIPRDLDLSYEEFRDWLSALKKHDRWEETIQPGTALSDTGYGLLTGGKIQFAQPGDEKHFQAFFKCFGGDVLCYGDIFGRLNLQVAYDSTKYDETAAKIAAFLQAKTA